MFLASKFGFVGESVETMGLNGSPEYVPEALERSLKRLGTDYIDLWYLIRSVLFETSNIHPRR